MVHTLGGFDVFDFVFDQKVTIKRAGSFVSWLTGSIQSVAHTVSWNITMYDDAYETNYDIGSAILIHEFGHLMDQHFGNLSLGTFREQFWEDCEPDWWSTCGNGHDPKCLGMPASVYAYSSPQEDFADLFAYYVYFENRWDVTPLFSQFMPPDGGRYDYMEVFLIPLIQKSAQDN